MAEPTGRQRWRVILLPGGVMPAEPAYRALLAALGDDVQAVAKDLEVYAGDRPPPDFTVETEVEGIRRAADAAGFDRFHLVGYSGRWCLLARLHREIPGATAKPRPVRAGLGRQRGAEPRGSGAGRTLCRPRGLPPDEFMARFVRYQLKPGVEPPAQPPGPPPPWMAKRPAGLAAFMSAFASAELDLARLRAFDRPVYFGLGGLSNPDYYARMVERLGRVFTDFTVEVYPDRHHFDPPHRIEPERVAHALRALWRRAEPTPGP